MFVWLLHFKGFFLYALLFYIKNVGCGSLFTSVHPNIYYRTKNFRDEKSRKALTTLDFLQCHQNWLGILARPNNFEDREFYAKLCFCFLLNRLKNSKARVKCSVFFPRHSFYLVVNKVKCLFGRLYSPNCAEMCF